jgi:hypothetical protein
MVSVSRFPNELRNLKMDDDDDIQDYVKPWVGLTDEEIDIAWRSVDYTQTYENFRIAVAKAVEKILRGKNV